MVFLDSLESARDHFFCRVGGSLGVDSVCYLSNAVCVALRDVFRVFVHFFFFKEVLGVCSFGFYDEHLFLKLEDDIIKMSF